MDELTEKRRYRVLKPSESHKIIYIKHLGTEPYNEVKFDCGKILIVSYSLNYWHSIFQNFQRINRGVLINPEKVIGKSNSFEVELMDNSKFNYSRRKLKSGLVEFATR